jgi:hypothetical protein
MNQFSQYFLLQTAFRLYPSVLIQNTFVQPDLLSDVAVWFFGRAFCRCGYVPHRLCFHNKHAVVLSDGRAELVEKIPAGVGHAGVQFLDTHP